MDSEADVIDPAWWAPDLDQVGVQGYEPVELFSDHLYRLARQDGLAALHHSVLETLALVSSAMLNPSDWCNPFTPAIQLGNRRSVVPADLTPEQIGLLAQIAPLVGRPDLQARIADVAWFYGDRSQVALLDTAIDAYCRAPVDGRVWFSVGRTAWLRAFELAKRRGSRGHARLTEMRAVLRRHVLAGVVQDRFLVPSCASLLRENSLLPVSERREIAESLARLAADALPVDPRLSRHLEREVAAWLPRSDQEAVYAAMS